MAAFRSSLMSNQLHAENLLGHFACFLRTLSQFHAAAFSATARMNLCFNDHD